MHICGMDFSSLASYWQIKALLMLEPSVVTPQNQYFPANSERMSVHCLESGCIGKYTHLGPRDFPRAGILHPSALEIALGLRPRAISRASGCKIPALRKSLGPRGVYFPIHPSSRQCTDTFFHHYQGSIDFNTVNIHRTVGMYFLVSTSNRVILNDMIYRDHIIQYTPCSRECTYQYCP